MRYNRKATTFNPAVAINHRKELALQAANTTRETLVKEIAAQTLCNIRTYRSANNAYDEADFVKMMRRLGGYSSMIETVIGPAPAAQENSIGMGTSDAYWVWAVKNDLKEDIRQRVQGSLHNEYVEALGK